MLYQLRQQKDAHLPILAVLAAFILRSLTIVTDMYFNYVTFTDQIIILYLISRLKHCYDNCEIA